MNAVGDKRRASSEDSAYYFCQSKNSVDPKTDPGYATRFGNRIPAIIATVTAAKSTGGCEITEKIC